MASIFGYERGRKSAGGWWVAYYYYDGVDDADVTRRHPTRRGTRAPWGCFGTRINLTLRIEGAWVSLSLIFSDFAGAKRDVEAYLCSDGYEHPLRVNKTRIERKRTLCHQDLSRFVCVSWMRASMRGEAKSVLGEVRVE